MHQDVCMWLKLKTFIGKLYNQEKVATTLLCLNFTQRNGQKYQKESKKTRGSISSIDIHQSISIDKSNDTNDNLQGKATTHT